MLDLGSYKGQVVRLVPTLTDAKTNLVQGYDRDTPAEMAAQGMKGFQEFFSKPGNMYVVMDRLEATRPTAYANAAAAEVAIAPTKGRKN